MSIVSGEGSTASSGAITIRTAGSGTSGGGGAASLSSRQAHPTGATREHCTSDMIVVALSVFQLALMQAVLAGWIRRNRVDTSS